MKVEVNQKFSMPRAIHGGSPQGSVSANALFCATVEFLQEGELEPGNTPMNCALVQNITESTMYPGETILGDIPSSLSVSFADNSWNATLLSEHSEEIVNPFGHVSSALLSPASRHTTGGPNDLVNNNGVDSTEPRQQTAVNAGSMLGSQLRDPQHTPGGPNDLDPDKDGQQTVHSMGSSDEKDCSPFKPRVSSTPELPGAVNYSSHVTQESDIDYHLDSTTRQRHQAGLRIPNRIYDTISYEMEPDYSDRDALAGLPEGWKDRPEWTLKYIDDGISGENVCNTTAITHITEKKQQTFLHAKRSE